MFQADFGVCGGNYSTVIKSRHLDGRLLPRPGLGALSLAATSTPKRVSEEPGLLCLSSPSSEHHAGCWVPVCQAPSRTNPPTLTSWMCLNASAQPGPSCCRARPGR